MKTEEPAAESKGGRVQLVVPQKRLQPLVGMYRDPATNEMIKLAVWDNKLTADVDGRNFPLSAIGGNRFRFDRFPDGKREIELETVPGGGRPRLRVVTTYEGGEIERQTFEPAEVWLPSSAELSQLAGRYTSEEVGTSWLLAVEDGKLFIRHRGISKKPLSPTVKDTFTLEGIQLTFERNAEGEVTGFLVDAGRVKGLSFRKQAASL